MAMTVVDRLHEEVKGILSFLGGSEEYELRHVADEHLKKSLLMAAASHFERSLTQAVVDFAEEVYGAGHVLPKLIRNKAVSRQYHTWFDWNSRNANQFFRLFGDDFKKHVSREIADSDDLESSIRAFLEIGGDRNRLVHQDYGNFVIEKTAEEIHHLYSSAERFVAWFPTALREYSRDRTT